MLKVFASSELESGYYEGEIDGVETTVTIDVTCSTCGKLVYRKECVGDGYYGSTKLKVTP